jgi:hypothetical protein
MNAARPLHVQFAAEFHQFFHHFDGELLFLLPAFQMFLPCFEVEIGIDFVNHGVGIEPDGHRRKFFAIVIFPQLMMRISLLSSLLGKR